MKMTNLFVNTRSFSKLLIFCCSLAIFTSCQKEKEPAVFKEMLSVAVIADKLLSPIGLETDASGRVWVAESGTGKCDGRVSIITTDGKVYPVITNFESNTNEMGETDRPTHLLFVDGCLYILGAKGKMYIAHVENFKSGDPSVKASTLTIENIGAFVLAYNFVTNAHDSHPYNLTTGPDGAIYIADAGANAIIKRAKNKTLSVLAEVPGINNPLPIGPPVLQSVPT